MKTHGARAATLLFGCLVVSIANAAIRDGNWWNTLDPKYKLTYVVGFFDGQSLAEVILTASASREAAFRKSTQCNAVQNETVRAILNFASERTTGDFKDILASNLVEGLNHIYADYRNARVSVPDAIVVVIRSINGMSVADAEKLLETKRSGEGALYK